jgi:fatty-acyl-CoA synthase
VSVGLGELKVVRVSVARPPVEDRERSMIKPTSVDTQGVIARARRQGVGDLLHRSAVREPGKTAIVCGDRRFTYLEFDRVVNRMAHRLEDRGLRKGDRVAVLSHNCWQFVALNFALARLGMVMVPINFMLNAKEVAFILGDAEVSGVMVEDALHPVMRDAIAGCDLDLRVRGWIALDSRPPENGWEDVDAWAAMGDDSEPAVDVEDDDPLRLMYTSGTESRPKGVMLSSRSLIAQYTSCIVDGGMAADDIEVHALPLYHCAQLDCFLTPDIYLGATSVILRGPEPGEILRAIEREGATKLFAPPTVWIALLRSPIFDRTDLSSLRKGYYGASAMPVEVLKEIQQRLPGVRLWNFYGQTEMAPVATILQPEEQTSRAGSAGRAVLNVEMAIVDDDDQRVPPGTVGEIVHRSPQATSGYHQAEDKTAKAFRNGWFHSGDLGVMTEDGYLSVVDRKKDMVKTGGENVASREVEEVIYGLESVAEVSVFGIPHPRWVEAVTAVVVPRSEAELSGAEVTAHCRVHLAGYKVPKFVVIADTLPKNPSGKVLKRELREQHVDLARTVTS